MGTFVVKRIILSGVCTRNSKEPLLETAGSVDVWNCVKPEELKNNAVEDGEKSWREKKMYGHFLRKPEKEALIFAARWQALRTNYVTFYVEKTAKYPSVYLNRISLRFCGTLPASIPSNIYFL